MDPLEDPFEDSYEGLFEDYKIRMTDAGYNSSAESSVKRPKWEPSSTEIYDIFDTFGTDVYSTAAYQKMEVDPYKFPEHVKTKEEMEIKDIVMDHALPFLPAKSLMRFRSVSKEWDEWITSPFLSHKQSANFRDVSGYFQQQKNGKPVFTSLTKAAYGVPDHTLGFLPEPVVIRSSCNGLLLCQADTGEKAYYVCNPSTKNWKMIPFPDFYHGEEPAILLAFEPKVLDFEANYHLICAVPMLEELTVHFEIYSSEMRSWTSSTAVCMELGDSIINSNGFYMEGIAYWETSSDKVLAFDFKNEIYQVLVLPSERERGGVLTWFHGELGYVCAHNQFVNLLAVDIYGNMGLKHSAFFDLGKSVIQPCRVLPCVNCDYIMILGRDVIWRYHLKDQRFEVFSIRGYLDPSANYLPYINSLARVA